MLIGNHCGVQVYYNILVITLVSHVYIKRIITLWVRKAAELNRINFPAYVAYNIIFLSRVFVMQ